MDYCGRGVPAGGRMDVREEEEMMKRKKTTIWCYLDGKRHCDVVQWALAANVMVSDAKKMLTEQYPGMTVTFKNQ